MRGYRERTMQKIWLMLVAILSIPASLQAGITIQVGDGGESFKQGDLAVIPVYMYVSSMPGGTYQLEQFITGFDLGIAGQDTGGEQYASWFNNSSITADFTGSVFSGFAGDPGLANRNFDLAVAGSSGSLNLATINGPANKIKLFDFKFSVDSNAQLGTYNFVFRPDATYDSGNSAFNIFTGTVNGNLGSNLGLPLFAGTTGGSFEVTAVPEPATICLIGFGLSGVGLLQIRKRKLKKPCVVEKV